MRDTTIAALSAREAMREAIAKAINGAPKPGSALTEKVAGLMAPALAAHLNAPGGDAA